jgi:hypothetical protein
MNNSLPCCWHPGTLPHGPSPFTRIVALGFYDGPTSGVVECLTCGSAYKFDMLDWDDTHEVRIFRLALLPPGALAECVQALAPVGPPHWPVWVPMRSRFPSDEAAAQADRDLSAVLAKAAAPELIVAWAGYGERILAAAPQPHGELETVPDWFSVEDPHEIRDWFSRLGLVKRKQEDGLLFASTLAQQGTRK